MTNEMLQLFSFRLAHILTSRYPFVLHGSLPKQSALGVLHEKRKVSTFKVVTGVEPLPRDILEGVLVMLTSTNWGFGEMTFSVRNAPSNSGSNTYAYITCKLGDEKVLSIRLATASKGDFTTLAITQYTFPKNLNALPFRGQSVVSIIVGYLKQLVSKPDFQRGVALHNLAEVLVRHHFSFVDFSAMLSFEVTFQEITGLAQRIANMGRFLEKEYEDQVKSSNKASYGVVLERINKLLSPFANADLTSHLDKTWRRYSWG